MKARLLRSATARLLDQTDWSATSLGPRAGWPRSLASHAAMIMELPSPAIIFWGEDQVQIYNDGYAHIMGPRHPRFFGAPYRDCWPDTHPLIYPWMRRVLDHGEVIEVERERIQVTRYGFEEDAWFTFTFSPLRDDDGRIAGILQPVFEVSDAVLGERRSALLARLAPGRVDLEGWEDLAAALRDAAEDVPFARWYRRHDAAPGRLARAAGDVGPLPGDEALRAIDAAAARAVEQGEAVPLAALGAYVLPLAARPPAGPSGAIALGINHRLHFDERYRGFLEQIARQVSAVLQWSAARREAERQRTHLETLFRRAPAGIALLEGPALVFRLCNPLYQALIGHRPVIGLPLREALPELHGQPFPALLDAVYRSGEACAGTEALVRLGDGSGRLEDRYFNYLYQPLTDDADTISGILVFCYDVTEQVHARQRSEALTRELQREHQLKDDFLAMLAHELRNPLAPIAAAAHLLGSGRLDAEGAWRSGAIVARQVRHLTELVGDLLDASRLTRGLVEIERTRQPIHEVVADALEQVGPLLQARGHRLAQQLAPGEPVVLGDRKRLVQIVANLLTNAAKYTPEGGNIVVSTGLGAAGVEISVADDGIGIDPELRSRIFEPFVQAARGRDRSEGGLGIGLPLVRTLVELHGGTVGCDSAGLGHGSRFTVRLPCLETTALGAAEMAEMARTAETAVAGAGNPPLRILVVDDNEDVARSLAALLELSGHRLEVVLDAREVLGRAAVFGPQMVFLDIGLPHLDGCELAQRLRDDRATAPAYLVAVSGYGQAADRARARLAGFDEYLVKPVDPAGLDAVVARGAARAAAEPGSDGPVAAGRSA